jgi:protein involved in polysaccharide export with SLBB domain
MFLRQQLPRLLERAGLLERDGARECVAQFFEPPAATETASAAIQYYPIESYPVQVGDRLQISVRGSGARSGMLRVEPDGNLTIPFGPEIAAVGKTTGQLEREIATILSDEDGVSRVVLVILNAPRSSEELLV